MSVGEWALLVGGVGIGMWVQIGLAAMVKRWWR